MVVLFVIEQVFGQQATEHVGCMSDCALRRVRFALYQVLFAFLQVCSALRRVRSDMSVRLERDVAHCRAVTIFAYKAVNGFHSLH
jgi:hypothetical protein